MNAPLAKRLLDCTVCLDSGKDEGASCRNCCCADCGEQVGVMGLVAHDGRRVCFSCKPAKCSECQRGFVLAALDDNDRCEECHVEEPEEPIEYGLERSAGGLR